MGPLAGIGNSIMQGIIVVGGLSASTITLAITLL
ncbi:hypothetical protein [Abiotrophia defectiva]|nr:hypothetical protein [Abiotrophia sp.]